MGTYPLYSVNLVHFNFQHLNDEFKVISWEQSVSRKDVHITTMLWLGDFSLRLLGKYCIINYTQE